MNSHLKKVNSGGGALPSSQFLTVCGVAELVPLNASPDPVSIPEVVGVWKGAAANDTATPRGEVELGGLVASGAIDYDGDGDPPFLHAKSEDDLVVGHNIPGSNASTIRLRLSWLSWSRSIFSMGTAFGALYRAQITSRLAVAKQPATASIWPMPLPYRRKSGQSRISEVEWSFQIFLNLQICAMNYLHLGSGVNPPIWVCGPVPLSKDQWAVVMRLRRLCECWKNLDDIPASAMGRTAAKQERQEELISALTKMCRSVVGGLKKYHSAVTPAEFVVDRNPKGKVVGKVCSKDLGGAQSIVASRLKMEGKPVFNPVPFLDDESRKLYEEPFHQNLHLLRDSISVPRVRVHADFDQKLQLLRMLNKSGRLVFRKPDELHLGFGNGLFCVPKSLEVDRLILDGRPANALQLAPDKFILTMASASSLLGISLAEDEKLICSGDDLSNFFYTFKVGYDRGSRNFLDWPIPTQVVRDLPGFPESLYDEPVVYACLNSLAMGDSAACTYAQTSHISMALQCGAFYKQELLTMHGRTPRSDVFGGIIIDDFILMQKVKRSESKGIAIGARRDRMHAMYNSVGLDAHPTKGFSDEVRASFWGADVDGDEGLIRGNVVRAASLCWITAKVASLGVSSIALLEIIAGGFVALFCFRRRMMCLLDLIYSVQAGRSRDDVVSLPSALVDELWCLALLSPLAVTDLRARYSDTVYMVDASNWGDAVVSADLGAGMQSEIHRHSLCKSAWTKLLSPFKCHLRNKGQLPAEEELPAGEVAYSEHPVWETVARCLDFSLCWKRRARKERHINIGELRAFLKAESVAGNKYTDVRVPIGGDSQVVCGVVCKGRSASPCLNRELRRHLPEHIGLGVYSSRGYVRSAHNPADDPTRGVDLRKAACHEPTWFTHAVEGSYDDMDKFLSDVGVSPHQLCGYPDLDELMLKDPAVVDQELGLTKLKRFRLKVRQKIQKRAVLKQKILTTVSKNEPSSNFPWDSHLHEILISFGKEQFIFGDDHSWPPCTPGLLDLYSGKKGYARAVVKLGAPWVLVVDILDGPQCDLLDESVRRKIVALLKGGVFLHCSAAPICSSFSTAITPPVRSPAEPQGIEPLRPTMKQRILDGNSHSQWLAMLVRLMISLGVGYWVENPDPSYLWRQPEWVDLPNGASLRFYRVDFCTFNTPWRKRTRFLTDGCLALQKRLCSRDHKHTLLRGRSRFHKQAMTKLAEPYPKGLCTLLGWAVCKDLNLLMPRSYNSYRCNHKRVGEAKNPGPRRPNPYNRDPSGLDRVELIRPETVAIGKGAWDAFLGWVRVELGPDGLRSLWLVPGLMGAMVGSYGRHLYESGLPLYVFRHLVVFGQRNFPGLRGFLQPAWDVINRWEEIEPVEHRRPLPLRLVEAMCALSLLWSWQRVCCVILICFHGCCRPGEVLKATRGHLVLPRDLGHESGPCFLRISKPKPGRRGLGRVQHAKIVDQEVIDFLDSILGGLLPSMCIFGGSPNMFRTRWDKLLRALDVPSSFDLTPAGLRAGGTVNLYRRGVPILDILWNLR